MVPLEIILSRCVISGDDYTAGSQKNTLYKRDYLPVLAFLTSRSKLIFNSSSAKLMSKTCGLLLLSITESTI